MTNFQHITDVRTVKGEAWDALTKLSDNWHDVSAWVALGLAEARIRELRSSVAFIATELERLSALQGK